MLTRRSLNLPADRITLIEPLLRRETLEECLLADEVLHNARTQAETILAEAYAEADVLRQSCEEQARAQVWEEAQVLLEDLRTQREQALETLVETAAQLVSQALESLLEKVPTDKKVRSVIRQLALASSNQDAALLFCHPDQLEAVALSLETHDQPGWTLRTDASLDPDAISLRTEHGDFSLGWSGLQQHIWP
ncbi:type III secretion system stator protein SctL [Pseudomonas viridiflava]|uniref:type III secretion system stator protein SctL n=1 Tax=Pseudomonas viridiflava TaxID=33069 RepID=UPI0013CE6DC7|nr:type III secretion system stator protein SctL [Pseudomonas viridiflava]